MPGDELLEDADGVATRASRSTRPRQPSGRGSPGRGLAVRSEDGDWVRGLVLEERGDRTGLPSARQRLGMVPMEPASLVMERKMLRGIRERAERLAAAAGAG